MIAGLAPANAHLRLYEGSIRSEQIVDVLKALVRQLGRKMLIIWDGLKVHRSRLVRNDVDSLGGKIAGAFLPPHAPI